MHNFPNTMPAVRRRMDEDTIARLRAAEGQIDDEHDADRDYGAEAGRYFGENVFAWSAIVSGLAMFALAVAVLFGHNPF